MKKKYIKKSFHKAFTLLELLFVIIIVGILAAMIIPDVKKNTLYEAAVQVMSDIRYTQHLAMIDDKYDPSSDSWYKMRWQIIFANSSTITEAGVTYTIFNDSANTSAGNPDIDEIAKNTLDKNKVLSGGHSNLISTYDDNLTSKLNLTKTYGISSYELNGDCSGARIAFDNQGRPINGDLASLTAPYLSDRLIEESCEVVLTNNDGNITIIVEPETGYVHLL